MSPTEINIAIAEACGAVWVASRARLGFPERLLVFKEQYHPESWDTQQPFDDLSKMEQYSLHYSIPNYCADLNAMHEAEKTLSDTMTNDQWSTYSVKLNEICCPMKCGGSNQTCGYTIHATASQRAEAFLRTIGKWRDQ